MKYILAALFVMLALVSFAYAEGTTVTVENTYSPSLGQGYVDINVDQTNNVVAMGNGNTVDVMNDKESRDYAQGVINQIQESDQVVVGDNNQLYQTNYALGVNYDDSSSITQTQSNFAAIVGNNNYMDQTNNAIAQIGGGGGVSGPEDGWNEYNSIDQTQSNLGLQVGDWNTLTQDNELQPMASGEDAGYDSNSGEWSDSWDYPNSGAVISYGSDNTISQTQSNDAAQVGTGNTAQQYNDAYAAISGNSNYVEQDQSNVGASVGGANNIQQSNKLDNPEYNHYTSDWSTYDWWNGYYVDWGESWSDSVSPVPGALILGDSNTIYQEQSNSVAQAGNYNWAEQYNDAYANIGRDPDYSGGFDNLINQEQSNAGLQVGDSNDINQNNQLVRSEDQYSSGWNDWFDGQYEYNDYWSDDQTLPIPGAQTGYEYNTIAQNQDNAAAQIGSTNEVDQGNDAQANDAYPNQDQPEYAYTKQDQSNQIIEVNNVGWYNNVAQGNKADAFNNGDDNSVYQTENNLAVVVGGGNSVGDYNNPGQYNYQYAYADDATYDGYDQISQDASNSLTIVGNGDTSYQTNNQRANQGYDTDNPIYQYASNENALVSGIDWLPNV